MVQLVSGGERKEIYVYVEGEKLEHSLFVRFFVGLFLVLLGCVHPSKFHHFVVEFNDRPSPSCQSLTIERDDETTRRDHSVTEILYVRSEFLLASDGTHHYPVRVRFVCEEWRKG